MVQLGWVIAAGVLFGLVHVLAYRYLRRDDGTPFLGGRSGESGPVATPDPRQAASGESGDGAPGVNLDEGEWCPTCGTLNDPSFTFCRQCTSRIDRSPA